MNFFIQRTLLNFSTATKKFIILKNRFLVPAKPKRLPSAYIIFSNQTRKNHEGKVTEVAKKIGLQWKALSQEEKAKYTELSHKQVESHKAQLKEYQEKYIQPFKRQLSLRNLAMRKLHEAQKFKSVTQGAKRFEQYFKAISPEEIKKLEQELNEIRQKRSIVQKEHQIPEPEFKTLRAFQRKELGDKSVTQLTQHQRQKIKQKFDKYAAHYEKTLATFAGKFDLTAGELKSIIATHQRRLKRQSASELQAQALDGQKVAPKKTTVKKASLGLGKIQQVATIKKKTTGAKRVVKARTTKTAAGAKTQKKTAKTTVAKTTAKTTAKTATAKTATAEK